MAKCKCDTCKLSKAIQRARPKWDKQTNKIVEELWNRMEWAETDAEVSQCRLHGTWPGTPDEDDEVPVPKNCCEVLVNKNGERIARYVIG